MELLQSLAGVKFQAVHYKGATPALTDVIAGHIQMMFISVGSAVPQWRNDKVKLIAVGAPKRMALLPEIPTVAESGLARLRGGVLVRPVRPARHARRRGRQDQRRGAQIFADPEIKKGFLERQYFESIAGSPDELPATSSNDEPKWRKVIQDAKVKPE